MLPQAGHTDFWHGHVVRLLMQYWVVWNLSGSFVRLADADLTTTDMNIQFFLGLDGATAILVKTFKATTLLPQHVNVSMLSVFLAFKALRAYCYVEHKPFYSIYWNFKFYVACNFTVKQTGATKTLKHSPMEWGGGGRWVWYSSNKKISQLSSLRV